MSDNVTSSKNSEEIINELIKFDIGTRDEILEAMNHVINKNDINEITDYINKSKQTKEVKSVCKIYSV